MDMLQRPGSREDFEIAIICALPVEFDAVEALFEKYWEDETHTYGKASGDPNAYTTGRIGSHNVVLAFMPSMGNSTSAGVAAFFRSSFPNIKLGLVVGVCGAVPIGPDDEEIILGDVIISTGVVQYDFGRRLPNGIVRRDTFNDNLTRPSTEIRTFLTKLTGLRTRTLLKNNASHFLDDILQKEGFEESRYPGSAEDKAYVATYRHKHQDSDACSTCAECHDREDEVCETAVNSTCTKLKCSDEMLLPRKRLKKTDEKLNSTPCTIHFGLMASGNLVMKSGQHRDEIAEKEKTIAFEMEGAGVWETFPTILVRGVSDYADSHKNKSWQAFAAAHAAACVKALLKHWRPADKMSNATPENSQVMLPQPEEHLSAEHQIVRYDGEESGETMQMVLSAGSNRWIELVSRISDYNYTKAHRRLSKHRLNGTGQWFLRHPTLIEWVENLGTSSLWCCGRVGFGKTMICTKVIDFLKDLSIKTGDPVVFFYFDPSAQESTKTTYVMKAIIKQLFEHMIRAQRRCSTRLAQVIDYFFSPSGPEADLEDLFDIFGAVLRENPGTWIVIDGLDELPQNEIPEFMSRFDDIFRTGSAQKLLIASRNEVGANMKTYLNLRIELLEENTTGDLRRYIDSEIDRKMNKETILTDDVQVIEEIRYQLSKKAEGMFLWVRLQIEALWLDCKSDADILSALDNLPRDLSATYERCLKRIPESSIDIARKALRWVICAPRPLHVDALREAVGFNITDHELDPAKRPSQSVLIRSCSNLVVLEETDQSVRIVHPSAKQYLCGFGSSLPGSFQIDIDKSTLKCGEECVIYLSILNPGLQLQRTSSSTSVSVPTPDAILSSMPFSNSVTRRISQLVFPRSRAQSINVYASNSRLDNTRNALLDYARENWLIHTRGISPASPVWNRFQELALQPSNPGNIYPWNPSGQSIGSHIHALLAYATRKRHMPLLRLLVDQKQSNGLKDFCNLPAVADGLPALHAASRLGYRDVVELLLVVCKANAEAVNKKTALQFAVEKNHLEVAKLLLSAKSISDNKTLELLTIATESGFEEMVSLLLGAHTSSMILTTIASSTPMKSVGMAASYKLNPYLVGAGSGQESIMRLLASKCGKVNKDVRHTAMCLAAANGHATVLRLLQEYDDGNINAGTKNKEGTPILQQAASKGYEDVLKLLLEQSSVEATDKRNLKPIAQEALVEAAEKGHDGVIKILVECTELGTDANRPNLSTGKTALSCASQMGHQEAVRLLLKQDVSDRSSRLSSVGIALEMAAHDGHEGVVRLLLKPDSNVSDSRKTAENGSIRIALEAAARKGHEGVVRLLLEQNGIETYSRSIMIALGDAVLNGHEGIARALLERMDTEKMICQSDIYKLVSQAAHHGHRDIARLLLTHLVAEVNMKDQFGTTPLIFVAKHEYDTVLQLLLERADIDVNLRDTSERTALFWAVERGNALIVKLLTEREDVEVNLQDLSGRTALRQAVSDGRTEIVKLLLKCDDIDINLQDHTGRTALWYATFWRHTEIAKLLLDLDQVDVDLRDQEKGLTARDVALQMGDKEIAALIDEVMIHESTTDEETTDDPIICSNNSLNLEHRHG